MSTSKSDLQRSVVRKTTIRIVPLILFMYFVCYLDRVNISYAALEMNDDIGLTDAAYGFGAGIFFIAYVTFQVPANVLLTKVGPRRWMGGLMVAWGVIALLMSTLQSPTQFFVLRFLLGIAEAGFFPALIFYIAAWFPTTHRGRIMAIAIAAAPLSGLVGGPLSTWLMEVTHGLAGLHGWQAMFIIEALPAVLLGFWALRWMPERPRSVSWLNTDEADWLQGTLDSEAKSIISNSRGRGVIRTIFSPLVLCLGLIYLGIEFGEYAFGFFLPLMVESLNEEYAIGLTLSQIGLVAAIPSLFGAVAMILWGRHSDRTQERTWHIVAPTLLGAVAIILTAYANSLPLAILGFSITAAAIFSAVPIFWTLPSQYLTGVAAAASIGMINAMGNFSGLLGPAVTGVLRDVTDDYRAGLWAIGGFLVIAAIATWLLGTRARPSSDAAAVGASANTLHH